MFYFFRFRFLSGCCKSSFVQHISIKMDLMCNEKETFKDHQLSAVNEIPMHIEAQVNTASADPTFLSERCLENLLKSEDTHPVVNFYNNPLCEITPKMRRIVAEWMMEVSFHVYHLLNDSIKFILLYFFVEPLILLVYLNRTLCNRFCLAKFAIHFICDIFFFSPSTAVSLSLSRFTLSFTFLVIRKFYLKCKKTIFFHRPLRSI